MQVGSCLVVVAQHRGQHCRCRTRRHVALDEGGRPGNLASQRQDLVGSPLQPANRQQMSAVVPRRVGVADAGTQLEASLCRVLGRVDAPVAQQSHHLDRIQDEQHGRHLQRIGAHAYLDECPFGAPIADQVQIDGSPQRAHQAEHFVARDGCDADQFVGDRQPFGVGVRRTQQRVVPQRQRLGQNERIVELPGRIDGVTHVRG